MGKLILIALLVWVGYLYLKPKTKPLVHDSAEARAILGVGPDASADEIRHKHRQLIQALHPDRGGSAELTRRINAARDTLLRRD